MKTIYSHDFFCYDPEFEKEHTDFTGDDSVSPELRMGFLKNYASFLKKNYNIPSEPTEVISEEELKKETDSLDLSAPMPQISKRLYLDKFNASLNERPCINGWQLYTDKVSISDDTVHLNSNSLAPTGAAAYFFDNNCRLKEFEFSFFMSSEYKAEIPGGILDTTYGRTVELRSGIEDVIKLQFYSDGRCFARLGNTCPYHLKNIFIDNFKFDVSQTVKIKLSENEFSVTVNGIESENLPLSSQLSPDMLYIGCGMFNVGYWKFTPLKMSFGKKEILNFFADNNKKIPQTEFIGEVTLPYSVGGFNNRDKYLILEKSFKVTELKKAYLNLESIDPCGSVYLNGSLIARADGFDSIKTDITELLLLGENNLKIIVDPRAPEVLFNWHRQKDAYNGWFCNSVWIDFYNKIEITNPKAFTVKARCRNVVCNIKADITENCKVNAYIKKIFPIAEEKEQLIATFSAKDNKIDEIVDFNADLWSVDTPNLYYVRLEAVDINNTPVDDAVFETGFRTICQNNGQLLLNGERIVLTGALIMQFLPPHSDTPVTHICPSTEQILWQELMIKRMNGNTMRIHILGYGTNDSRYARIADRLGLMTIWTTRYIDSVEQMAIEPFWSAKDGYLKQISERINNPSIIMWEGTNEYHPTLNDIDRIYEAFVPAVKKVDATRLICPISHLYYAGDMIPKPNCAFYNDDGTADQAGNKATANKYWNDELVVRSAHTYEVLLGYGTPWRKMRNQEWSMQPELYNSTRHAYIVSEFAVTARQNPNSPKAQEFFNHYSYEFPDEDVLGFRFKEEEWQESQAYQALAAKNDVKVMRLNDVDGMLWCCLMGGANDAGYLKPPIDCYGYPKFAFYSLKEGYNKLYAADSSLDVLKPKDFEIFPTLFGTEENRFYNLTVILEDNNGNEIERHTEKNIKGSKKSITLPSFKPQIFEKGYYSLKFEIEEIC